MILKHYKGLFVLENQISVLMKVIIVTLDWMKRKSSFTWFKLATEISYFTFLMFFTDDFTASYAASVCCDFHITEDSVILCNSGSFGNRKESSPYFLTAAAMAALVSGVPSSWRSKLRTLGLAALLPMTAASQHQRCSPTKHARRQPCLRKGGDRVTCSSKTPPESSLITSAYSRCSLSPLKFSKCW